MSALGGGSTPLYLACRRLWGPSPSNSREETKERRGKEGNKYLPIISDVSGIVATGNAWSCSKSKKEGGAKKLEATQGFEPWTLTLRVSRSTTELYRRCKAEKLHTSMTIMPKNGVYDVQCTRRVTSKMVTCTCARHS